MATPDRYLWHVTLTTGHTRKSWRHEVGDDVIAVCRELLSGALRGLTPVPGMPCRMSAESTAKALLVTITRDADPVVTIGVARHSRGGSTLWKILTEVGVTTPIHPSMGRCPPEPWCAARLEPGIALLDERTCGALGDLERCIAWAWLEK